MQNCIRLQSSTSQLESSLHEVKQQALADFYKRKNLVQNMVHSFETKAAKSSSYVSWNSANKVQCT